MKRMTFKEAFGLSSKPKRPEPVERPKLTEPLKVNCEDPNPPQINFNPEELPVLWEWRPGFIFNGKPFTIGVGESGDSLIFGVSDITVPRKWTIKMSLEKKNLQEFIDILYNAARGKMTYIGGESILKSPPDAIEFQLMGDKFDNYTLSIGNFRDVVINGERMTIEGQRSISFDGMRADELVEGLKIVQSKLQQGNSAQNNSATQN